MRQVAGLISTYSSDAFGICSALYELGGMVVMHDASGCNSTYTTHDEPRWYDIDSMIYISAISEMEAILGDDDKLIRDLIETAEALQPAFIALVGAPIPYMIGTDLLAIAAIVEQSTCIPSFGFAANGMQHYTRGISMALSAIVDRFCMPELKKTDALSVNILGATPLDFSLNGSVDSIKSWLQACGMEINACLAMGSTLEDIKKAGQAHVNLVVSYGGLGAAVKLWEAFGIPYVAGVPFGEDFARHLGDCLQRAAKNKINIIAWQDHNCRTQKMAACPAFAKPLAIIGEAVFSASLAAAIELERGVPVRMLCPLDSKASLLREQDLMVPDEDDILMQLSSCSGMIADPLYQALCPKQAKFYPLPHEAFSGRIYDAVNPNLINRRLSDLC